MERKAERAKKTKKKKKGKGSLHSHVKMPVEAGGGGEQGCNGKRGESGKGTRKENALPPKSLKKIL